jgi:chromosome partitioning protein
MNSMMEIGAQRAVRIAVSNQKGGVAKTTTCLSLGACLAELGKIVLLIDLDPQSHLTQSLGFNPEKIRRTVGDVLLLQSSLLAVSRETNVSNIELIPANNGLLIIDKLLYNSENYENRLKSNLDSLNGKFYDYIVMDCPPNIGPITINALSAADLAIIPVSCDFFAVKSLENYLSLINLVQRKSNPSISYRILVTMFDRRTKLSHMMLSQYQQKYAKTMLSTVISLDVRLRESPIFSQPVIQYASNSRSAEDYRCLARELISCQKMMN